VTLLPDADINNPSDGARLFVVIGTQRSGTNLLREILNTNEKVAMLGEVLMPSPAPAHWDNFCRGLPAGSVHPDARAEADSLLNRYFDFVQYRIRNHWENNCKSGSRAFGVDIKYDQLERIAPADWHSTSPFILRYLQSRGAIIIHVTRNEIHCAVSAWIAAKRNLWHNYDGVTIDRSYEIDVTECLLYARTIARRRASFVRFACDCVIVHCRYESLIEDLQRAGPRGVIAEGRGPLLDIAAALGVPFEFRYERRPQKAITVPYSQLLSNYDALVRQLRDSEFSAFASTME